MFHTDSVMCGISALALKTNAPTLLREEALTYKDTKGATVFGSSAHRLNGLGLLGFFSQGSLVLSGLRLEERQAEARQIGLQRFGALPISSGDGLSSTSATCIEVCLTPTTTIGIHHARTCVFLC
ncbi:prpD1 [Symbiodinium necroappetens]|uniref:PrpD1 protein n=1 Tax=Symbiodinium necroappetens TaxID=1628268 RepID=A0A813CKF7_9DINO|nr:prpD1 [Symbiodinium necroappetens]